MKDDAPVLARERGHRIYNELRTPQSIDCRQRSLAAEQGRGDRQPLEKGSQPILLEAGRH